MTAIAPYIPEPMPLKSRTLPAGTARKIAKELLAASPQGIRQASPVPTPKTQTQTSASKVRFTDWALI